MDEIKLLIKGREQNTFAIHYSCDGFYGGGAIAPAICTIAMRNIKTNELHTFALANYILAGKCLIEAEKELLNDFATFYKSLKNPILVHWQMDEMEYGFQAINARCENFGIYDLSFGDIDTIDFSNTFCSSLKSVLERNNCNSVYFLSGKQELQCLDKRNYNAVKLSTEAKTTGISKLFNLALKNEIEDGIYDN